MLTYNQRQCSKQIYARFQKERVEAFSDGIFAISVTLVAVNLRPPELGEEDVNLFFSLLDMWQQFYSQILSFMVYYGHANVLLQQFSNLTVL